MSSQKNIGEYAWAGWLAGTLSTFAVLEVIAYRGRFPTLSAALQRWLGIRPPTRWGEAAPVLFLGAWAWLTLHVVRYEPRIVFVSETDAVTEAEEIAKEAAVVAPWVADQLSFDNWPATLAVAFGPYRAITRHHVDGDTYDFFLDLGWNDYRYGTVRLLGVDTPEINRAVTREAGLAALAYVRERMPIGARVRLYTRQDPDSFGRYLAKIELEDGSDLAEALISTGHAKPA